MIILLSVTVFVCHDKGNVFFCTINSPVYVYWKQEKKIVGLCVNLDAASLMALVIVFKCSLLLLSVFTAVKESVCIAIVSLVFLAFSSANRMAVISASSTDAVSLRLMMISLSCVQLPPPPMSHHLNRQYFRSLLSPVYPTFV